MHETMQCQLLWLQCDQNKGIDIHYWWEKWSYLWIFQQWSHTSWKRGSPIWPFWFDWYNWWKLWNWCWYISLCCHILLHWQLFKTFEHFAKKKGKKYTFGTRVPAFNLSTVTLAKLRKRFPTTIILMRLVQLLEVWELQLAYMSLPLSLVALVTFLNLWTSFKPWKCWNEFLLHEHGNRICDKTTFLIFWTFNRSWIHTWPKIFEFCWVIPEIVFSCKQELVFLVIYLYFPLIINVWKNFVFRFFRK